MQKATRKFARVGVDLAKNYPQIHALPADGGGNYGDGVDGRDLDVVSLQFAAEPVEQAVDNLALARTKRLIRTFLPEGRFFEHGRENLPGAAKSAAEVVKKPQQP